MMADTPETEQQPPEGKPDAFVNFWLEQLDAAKQEFKDWETRCKKIKRRYRDERSETQDGTATPGFRFNALWSNIQTLMPAVYINPPKPVAERRFLDKDTMARYASMTLERSLSVQIEVGYLHTSTQKAVLDWLLFGRGVVWQRYEPKYGEPMDLGETEESEKPADPAAKGETEAVRPVTYEKVCTDYVAHDKFRHSPAAIWDDVWWVAKEEMLTRRQLRERFKGEYQGKLIADLIPLQSADKDKDKDRNKGEKLPRACIWEIWDKSRRQVIFIAPDWPNAVVEKADDPLHLETFWPCPEPLYATLTNDTLVPVPDFVEYQDQADELDNLTARIKALTDAVRVNGVYDSSVPELKRILQEGTDNRLIGVKNWSELTSKGGLAKSIDFVPFKDVVEALLGLYDARDRVKADMAEITGLSDIIRGQAQGQAKTATEQRIKGQFASLRLEDRKKAVARFCRDTIRIAGEIISEQFEPKLLAEMTGMVPFIATELEDDMQGAAITQQQQPGMGHNGGPPMQSPPLAPAGASPPQAVGAPGGTGLPPAAGMQPPQPPDVNMLAEQKFMEACQLLKSDKMRTFRIDIETDSTIEVDKQDAKDSVVELFTALGGMLEKAIPAGQALPELVPALGQSLLFAFRRFGAGRDVEGAWENAVDQMIRKAKNPPPPQPSPEQIKAEAEKQKLEMESQQMQQQAGLDQQKAQMDMQVAQAKAQLDIQKQQMQLQIDQQKLQLEREKMEMERQKMAMGLQVEQQKMVMEAESAERDAAFDERQAQRDEARALREDEMADKGMEREQQAGEEKFKLDQKVAKAKAAQAVKPKEKA